ncbi:MAG: hypothetical protein Fur005_21900 [Roseiflexaceae bacterium]
MSSKREPKGATQFPPLSETQIRQHANAESFARRVSYYQRGAVGALVLRGDLLQAEVIGSEYEPYRVAVSLNAGSIRSANCSCPYDWAASASILWRHY